MFPREKCGDNRKSQNFKGNFSQTQTSVISQMEMSTIASFSFLGGVPGFNQIRRETAKALEYRDYSVTVVIAAEIK